MEFASPSVRIFARFHYFLPALALCTAGAYLGGYGGASIIYLSQALFGWGAYSALARGRGAGAALAQRLPGQLVLLLLIALMGVLLLGVPATLALGQPGWVSYSVFGFCAVVLLIGGARLWAAPGAIFAAEDDALTRKPLQQVGFAARMALELTRGHIERSIEGTPLLAALLTVLLLPFVLVLAGLTPAERLYWGLIGAAALLSPLLHGYLIAEVRQLLGEQAPPSVKTPTATAPVGLVDAARSGDLAHLRMLIGDGRLPETQGSAALFASLQAPARLRPDILGLLFEHGAPLTAVDDGGMTALHRAALSNDIRSIELLLNAGAEVEARDREGRTALAAACEQANWGAAQTLLKLGADPAGGSMPPLHAAAICEADEPAGVELLRSHGAETDVRGKLGRTALMGAAMRGNALIVSALLEAGADIDAQDNFGNTALMEAARAGANAVLERLSAYQPQTESRDKPGRTALLVAVSSRRADPDTIRLLLAMGADPSVRNREGREAAELAVSAGRWRIARALGVQGGPVSDDLPAGPAAARVTAHAAEESTRVIDLSLFETAEDREWAARQMEKRSRTQLESATVQMEAVQIPDAPAQEKTGRRSKATVAPADQPQAELPLDSVTELPAEAGETQVPVSMEAGEPDTAMPAEAVAAEEPVSEPSPDQTRAGYQTLLQAAMRDDLDALQMVLETEEEIPEWWLVTAFLSGVAAGCAVAPRWLLERGLNANAHNEAGVPLISSVAQQAPPNLQVLEDLLAQGARTDTDPRLLHWLCGQAEAHAESAAALDEHEESRLAGLLEALLAGGAPIDALDDEGRTPLHWAAVHRSLPCVERLLAAGAPVDAQDSNGNTALMLAVDAQRTGISRALIKAGADARIANAKGTSPMSVAMDRRDPTLSKVLMSGKPSPPKPPEAEPTSADLIRAAADGKLGRVKRFLGRGVAIDARDERGCSALLRAAGEGHADVVSALLSAGANPAVTARNRTTPLGAAVLGNHIEVIKVLCDRGVDANQRQQYGITPLMLAAARWQPRATSSLLGFDADPNARDDTEGTPLMAAVQNALNGGDIDAGAATIKMLIKAGADVNAANDEGQTPLMLLLGVRARADARAREADLMRIGNILLEAGAEIDRQDLTGWSALHAAAAHGFRDAAALLMDRGASRRLRDINGLSPVDLAMDNAHDALVDLFIERA